MSYSDERDDIAELFGAPPSKKTGYSDDLDLPPRRDEHGKPPGKPPQPTSDASTKVEVKKPVKLRPPQDVKPHPLETSLPPQKAPAPPESEVEDEELLVYEESDTPDFSESDFFSFDSDEPPKKQAPVTEKEQAPPFPDLPPAAESELPPQRSAPPPVPVAPSQKVEETGEKEEAKRVAPAEPPVTASPPAQSAEKPVSQEKLLLDTHGLKKIYDGRTVVNGVDINVRPGEIVGLLGPNGAGKTTSFYMIVGLVPPNGGSVTFNGQDVTKMPMYKRARIGMGYLPQEESIFRKLTVEENIMAVMETLKMPRKEKVSRCNELLERFKITHIRKNVALTCSGGEKRRLTIARSLVTQPTLLMLDEPFSGVDPIAVNEIQNIVEDLRRSGLAILITDHNARQTLELVDRAYLIYEGKVLREGTRDFLINDPVSRELYLGDRFTM